MSRKHNTKHRRSPSHYPERLRDRGETSASVAGHTLTANSTARALGMTPGQYAEHCRRTLDKFDGKA